MEDKIVALKAELYEIVTAQEQHIQAANQLGALRQQKHAELVELMKQNTPTELKAVPETKAPEDVKATNE